MSLLQRVERAQKGAALPTDEAVVPAVPSAPASAGRTPARDGELRDIRLRLQQEVIRAFASLIDVSADDARVKVEEIVGRIVGPGGFAVTRDERLRLTEEMVDELIGFGPLVPLLRDPTITEVMVNGPNHIYVAREGKIQRMDSFFLNDDHVLRVVDRIITPMGRRIDETSPRVDARLPDGSRVNAVIEPLSLVGPVITVRKFSAKPYTVEDLIRFGTASPDMFEFLRACVEARLNVFV